MLPRKHKFLLIICCFFNCTNAWREYKFDYTYLNITPNTEIVNANGSLGFNSVGHKIINFDYELLKKITGNFFINILVTTIKTNNVPFRTNTTMDACAVLKQRNLPPIINGIYQAVTFHMDMPLKCPIEPLKVYHITNVGAAEELLPPYLPFGLYRLTLTAYIQPKKNTVALWCRAILRISIIKNNEKRPTRAPRIKF